ncbi:MAG: glycosyltransferase family 4 protein [Acidimicrobiia bacterium]
MKLVVTTAIYPPEVGGPATYVERLLRTLGDNGYLATAISTDPFESSVETIVAGELHRVSRAQPLLLRMSRFTGKGIVAARKADVIYANGCYLESLIASKSTRTRLVIKVVGDYSWETAYNDGKTQLDISSYQHRPAPDRKARLIRRLQKVWCRSADRIIVSSQFLQQIVEGWGVPRQSISVIPNPVEIPSAPPRFQVREPPNGVVSAITGGRFLGWKRFDHLIRVAAATPNLTLAIVGSGEEEDFLRDRIRQSNVEDRVTLLPPRSPTQMDELYRQFDVFMLASSSDTFSYMTIEAMAAGLPALVGDLGALPETCGGGRWGLVLPAEDVSPWSQAIADLGANPDRYRTLASSGYEAARDYFDWEGIYRRTMDLLLDVA